MGEVRRHFRLVGGRTFSVTYEAGAVYARLLEGFLSAFAPLRQRGELDVVLEESDGSTSVLMGGVARFWTRDALDVVPWFEGALAQWCFGDPSLGWSVHAAVLEREGGAVVLSGASGAGKTTLAGGLVERGWRYMSDEWCVITLGGRTGTTGCWATGMPRAPRLDADAMRGGWPGVLEVDYPWIDRAGEGRLSRLLRLERHRRCHEALPVKGWVHLRRDEARAGWLRRMSVGEGLMTALRNTLCPGGHAARSALRACAGLSFWELTTGNLEQSCARVEEVSGVG